MKLAIASIALALWATACGAPTEFRGAAKIPDGRAGCQAVCQKWDMQLVGMVQMGDYSNGCICQVKGLPGVAPAVVGAAAVVAPAVLIQSDPQHSIGTIPPSMSAH